MSSPRVDRRAVLASVPAIGGALLAAKRVTAAEPGTIRFAYFGDETEQLAYARLVAAFESKFPSLRVEPMAVASNNVPPAGATFMPAGGYPEWLRLSFTSDAPPDVFLLGYRDLGRYAINKVAEPLGPYLRGSAVIQPNDFYTQALDAFQSPY